MLLLAIRIEFEAELYRPVRVTVNTITYVEALELGESV